MPIDLPDLSPDMHPLAPAERLAFDARAARDTRDALEDIDANDDKLLCILSAGDGAEDLWRLSLARLLDQCDETRRKAVIILGLDGTFPPVNTGLRIPLWHAVLRPKASPSEPSGFLKDSEHIFDSALARQRHTILALQRPSQSGPLGKISMLNDVAGGVIASIGRGVALPSRMLLMDAESYFTHTPPGTAPDFGTNGLAPLLDTLDAETAPDILGARTWNTAYQRTAVGMLPNLATPIGPIHRRMNRTHGHPGHTWLTGGGIAGHAPDILALLRTVSRYPGLRADDSAMQKVGGTAGMKIAISGDAMVTNRAPAAHDRTTLEQLARWRASKLDLDEYYGKNDAGLGLGTSLGYKLKELVHEAHHPRELLRLLWQKFRVNRRAKARRGDILDGKAVW